jgi:hypothetical protein
VTFECESEWELSSSCYRKITNGNLVSPYFGEGYEVDQSITVNGEAIMQDECPYWNGVDATGKPLPCDDIPAYQAQNAVWKITEVVENYPKPLLITVGATDVAVFCRPPCGKDGAVPFTACNSAADLERAQECTPSKRASGLCVPPKSCHEENSSECCCDLEEDPGNEKTGAALKQKNCLPGKWKVRLDIDNCDCTEAEDIRDTTPPCSKSCYGSVGIYFNCDPDDQWGGPIGPIPEQVLVGVFRNYTQLCYCPCGTGFLGGRLCNCMNCEMNPAGFFLDTGSFDFMNQGCFGWDGKDIFSPMKDGVNQYRIRAKRETHLKKTTLPASQIPDEPPGLKVLVPRGRTYTGVTYLGETGSQILFKIKGKGTWWVFNADWEVVTSEGKASDACDIDRAQFITGEMSWAEAKNKYDAGGKYTIPCGIVFYGVHQSCNITDYDYWSPYGKIPYPPSYCPKDP